MSTGHSRPTLQRILYSHCQPTEFSSIVDSDGLTFILNFVFLPIRPEALNGLKAQGHQAKSRHR